MCVRISAREAVRVDICDGLRGAAADMQKYYLVATFGQPQSLLSNSHLLQVSIIINLLIF